VSAETAVSSSAALVARRLMTEVADPLEIRRVVGNFATGITVVTVGGGTPHGMTANAFTSVSLDPPLILICVNRDALLHESVVLAGSFAVSVLGAGQEHLARHFADKARPLGQAQFDNCEWFAGPHTKAPMIHDALAHLECALWRIYDGGDHSIILGQVLNASCDPGDALLFFGGGYHEVSLNS
jgi:flavin reductase (DIM6/NTAB) family NADH-FMN oxidoreductase RutF